MIFRHAIHEIEHPPEGSGIRPAFQVFLDEQTRPYPPQAVVLQPDHAKLAGEIAKRLRREVFGDIPADVLAAIGEHDSGWGKSDEDQLAHIATRPLRPFPRMSPAEALPSWRECVRAAKESSPLEGVIVSRHFCALAATVPGQSGFGEEENPRREQIERELNIPRQDLDRWTAAIGFCDLVSLYLCSGAREPATFPLAHPSLPDSHSARKVFLEWVDGLPRFTSPIVEEGAVVSVISRELAGGPDIRVVNVEWQF